MHPPVNHQQSLMGDFSHDFQHSRGGDPEDDATELQRASMADSGSGEGSGDGGSPVSSRGNSNNAGCIRDRPVKVIPCPRCQSMNTKFCYYNNYSVNQPRHFCRNCQRYWTVGGTLRNVPVGGGSRKKTRTRSRSDAHPYGPGSDPSHPPNCDVLLNASSCMQQLSMLPPALGGFGFGPAAGGPASHLPYLQFAMEHNGMFHKGPSLAGLQEVPDMQTSFYDVPQVPQLVNSEPMVSNNGGFFLPEFSNPSSASPSDALTATKASMWSSSPVQQMHALAGGSAPSWEDRQKANSSTMLQQLSGYDADRKNPMQAQPNATVLPQSWAAKQASFWDTSLLQQQQQPRPLTHNDRLVPHTTWDDSSRHPRNVSPNGSNITTEDSDRCLPTFGYHDDVASQPWVGLQASDILF